MPEALLEVDQLTTVLHLETGPVNALEAVSFTIHRGETLGLVGESGCGKSLTALSVMQLLAYNSSVGSGRIKLEGDDLLKKTPRQMRQIRGNDISMIFQEPMTSLNPVYTVGNQLTEAIRLHQGVSRAESKDRAVSALSRVGIPLPERRINEYPHQLSGGMRQRVMIAMALACEPKLLIADEPTTALDVTIQAQILRLIRRLKDETDMAVMLITHDLGVVAEMCDRVLVMYAGKVVEESPLRELFQHPRHPYTRGLINSIPRIDGEIPESLPIISGMVPQLTDMPQGCRFHPRCPYVMDVCSRKQPLTARVSPGHWAACWQFESSAMENLS